VAVNLLAITVMDESRRKEVENRVHENFRWYLKHQDELVESYNGKHLVIVDKKVVGAYDKRIDAYYAGAEKYGLGYFSLQRCSPGETDTVIHDPGPWFPASAYVR
jgi:hypothetical protein